MLLISMARRQFLLGVYLIKYTGELAVTSVYLEPGCCSSFQCFCVKAPFLLKFGSMTLDLGHVVGFVFEDITVPGLTRFPCSCSLVCLRPFLCMLNPAAPGHSVQHSYTQPSALAALMFPEIC